MTPNPFEKLVRGTREAQDGVATCGLDCGRRGPFKDFITVMYGGGLAFAMCMPCAVGGARLLIQRGAEGIEILKQGAQRPVGIATSGVDVLTRRPGR